MLFRSVGDDGTIDYAGLADEPALPRYVGWTAVHGPETDHFRSSDDNKRLAWSINVVNAQMLWAQVEGFTPQATEAETYPRVNVLLDNELVRLDRFVWNYVAPLYEEPMAVAALACGVRSCPPLSPRMYLRNGLDLTLDRRMRLWAASGDLVHEEGGTLVFSPALRPWMKSFDMFEGLDTPCAVVAPHAAEPLATLLRAEPCNYRWGPWDDRRREGAVDLNHEEEPVLPDVPEPEDEAEPAQ